ncbi:MAG TPA: SCO family protein [Acidobacteriota bacterium]|nr:SCO family protein [Acidobacteriota bacterium]
MNKPIRNMTCTLVIAALCLLGPAVTGASASAKRTTVGLTVPEVTLVRADGKSVLLPQELNDGRPVVLSFIFTTCTSICPLLTGTLAQLQDKLGADRDRVHIVSISIDPEEDTPAKLEAYAKKYHAGPAWNHYTGTVEAIIKTATAFGTYRGNKMAHTPVIFVRKAPGEQWVRFDGFATAKELLQEIPGKAVASK